VCRRATRVDAHDGHHAGACIVTAPKSLCSGAVADRARVPAEVLDARSPTSLDLIFTHARWTPDEARSARLARTVRPHGRGVRAQHSIQAQRLFAWRRKFAGEPRHSPDGYATFVEVAARREVARTLPARYELVLPTGIAARGRPIEMGTVRALLALLREATRAEPAATFALRRGPTSRWSQGIDGLSALVRSGLGYDR